MNTSNKLVIVGLGHVGSAVLNSALAFNLASDIALIDIDEKKAVGEALDASHGTPFTYSPSVKVYAGGYEECRDAKVIIIAAGPSIMPGEKMDRLLLADRNVKTIKEVMASITRYTKEAVIIVITNPLDVVAYCAQNLFDYPRHKVFGTGTMLETARLRRILANRYAVDPKNVHGYMLGEHGNSAFPAWSLVRVAGIPYDRLDEYFKPDAPLDTEKLGKEVVNVAYDVLQFKGCTNSGIAIVACRLARTVLYNEGSIFPISTTLEGEYGLDHVALSLPCQVTREGVKRRLTVPLVAAEIEKLQQSAASISQVLKSVGVVK
ncbi:L-lactate dehydrogenase 2 [Propionispora sp. 2/2-37]|uniref:L-lactate dehydrogenase n=1 Tax=Propionispora sp. 2/2-37 TaxID=1677858 RepID=UPI0006BB68A2|nr:L-lactate dehydrogenase [Propionispora sp. 2/2-37]CUH94878.1 L-lactate dehydrogenase 2 [Propionispora sp. 2/2-37]